MELNLQLIGGKINRRRSSSDNYVNFKEARYEIIEFAKMTLVKEKKGRLWGLGKFAERWVSPFSIENSTRDLVPRPSSWIIHKTIKLSMPDAKKKRSTYLRKGRGNGSFLFSLPFRSKSPRVPYIYLQYHEYDPHY